MPDAKSSFRYIARDLAAKSGTLRRLLRHGFFSDPDKMGLYEMEGRDTVLDFLRGSIRICGRNGRWLWRIVWSEAWRKIWNE